MEKIIVIKSIKPSADGEVCVLININGQSETIVSHFSENVRQYLTLDRIDAVVMGLMFFAIKNGYDFESELPISAELKYNLDYHFIPSLLCNEGYHRVKIKAPVIHGCEKRGSIVSTGISCGVDSLYTVASYSNIDIDFLRLTHLSFFDVGSHRRNGDPEHSKATFAGRLAIAKNFCKEYGYPLIVITSDICELIAKYNRQEYNHIEHDTYMMSFCVLMIQSGVRTYLCSSSNTYDNFTCHTDSYKDTFGCDNYELLILTIASVNRLKFISAGGATPRVEKVKYLCNYPPAYKYLNVCICGVENDSTCSKCVRTLMAVNAFDSLEKFRAVFDIDHFRANFKRHLYDMYIEGEYLHWKIVKELFPYYSEYFTPMFKIKLFLFRVKRKLRNILVSK